MKQCLAAMAVTVSLGVGSGLAQDWPQWRGANRDGKAANFTAPKVWPKELIQKWKVTVGEGVATPALVGDRLYVFSRQEGNEVTRALSVTDGKELWVDRYESLGATGPAQSFSGPRSSPAVAEGRVVTLGVRGMLSSLDAASGKKLWRKDDFHAYPNFFPSSSPMVVNGLAIAQLGGRENGALVAYDLTSGDEKWKWNGPSPAYASPVLMTVDGTRLVIAQTEAKWVAISAADGTLAWESAAPAPGEGPGGGRGMGGGRDYRAATPIVDGQVIIIAGRGINAMKLEKDGDRLVGKEVWSNPDKSVSFNTPTLTRGILYGLTGNNELFSLNASDGGVAWSAPFPGGGSGGASPRANIDVNRSSGFFGQPAPGNPPEGGRPRGPGGPEGPGGPAGRGGPGGPGGRRGGMGGGGGFGSIVDAGPVLLALTPDSQLIVFEPVDKGLKQLASYKVSDNQTHAYPVVSGNRIFIKDKETVTLWTVE